MDHQETKACTKCGALLPPSDFYIKNKQTGRRFSWCKACHNTITLASYHRRNPPKPKPSRPTEKACTQCGVVYPVEQYHIKDAKTGRRHSICPSCRSKERADYSVKKQDVIKAANARYRERNREALRERQRIWREAHPEEYAAIHSRWKKRNTDRVNSYGNKRRVLEKANGGHYTAQEWQELKAKYDQRCLMCERQEPEIKLTVDHVIPISQGGPNTIENIQPLCKSCNSKKHRGIVDLRKQE